MKIASAGGTWFVGCIIARLLATAGHELVQDVRRCCTRQQRHSQRRRSKRVFFEMP